MEHDARKMTALAILLLLLGAGVVGVGYAAFSGTASTYNENNSATAGYLYLDSVDGSGNPDWSPIVNLETSTLEINTYTYHVDTPAADPADPPTVTDYVAYYYTGATQQVEGKTYYVAAVPNAEKVYTLHNLSGESISSVNFTATAAGTFTALAASDFKYILKVTTGTDSMWMVVDDSSLTDTLVLDSAVADGSSVDITVSIYVGYDNGSAKKLFLPDTKIGPAAASDATHTIQAYSVLKTDVLAANSVGPVDLVGISFAFTATQTP